MNKYFSFDQRLGIHLPDLSMEWDYYPVKTQEMILLHWQQIRGSIPDRINDLEKTIIVKQTKLSDEEDFSRSCELNSEIAELASIINDLWIWYRENPDLSAKAPH